jgi:hypothetical protein
VRGGLDPLNEVREFFKYDVLRALPANVCADYHEKWKRIVEFNRHTDAADRFEAGSTSARSWASWCLIFGGLLALGVVSIEVAARAPTAVRLARGALKNAADDVARARPPRLAPIESEPTTALRNPKGPPDLEEQALARAQRTAIGRGRVIVPSLCKQAAPRWDCTGRPVHRRAAVLERAGRRNCCF